MELLLQDAHQEIANLRADLFQTRRVSEERRQALEQLGQAKSKSDASVAELAAQLSSAREQLSVLQSTEAALHDLQARHAALQQELEMATQARRILQEELQTERRQRSGVEEAKAVLEVDRARLQKLREELTAQLRVAQHRAQEAEDEQIRAEQECADARAELASATAMQQFMHTLSSSQTNLAGLATDSQNTAALAAQVPSLTQQLELERSRGANLLSNLHAAKAEISALMQQLHEGGERRDADLDRARAELAALAAELGTAKSTIHKLEQQQQQQPATGSSRPPNAAQGNVPTSNGSTGTCPACGGSGFAVAIPHDSPASAAGQQPSHSSTNGTALLHDRSGGGGGCSTSGDRGGGDKGRLAPHLLNGRASNGMGGNSHSNSVCDLSALDSGGLMQEVERLRDQVYKLRASRDKLLREVDGQWDEMEKQGQENRALSEELTRTRAIAESWEAQAQDGLRHIATLKDLLEESALWSLSGSSGGAAAPGGTAVVAPRAAPPAAALESLLLQEKARCAELELQLRALAAELVRAQHSTLDLGRSVLPLMAGVEYRLSGICQRAMGHQLLMGGAGHHDVGNGARMLTSSG